MPERVLALDLSTSTGYALLESPSGNLITCNVLKSTCRISDYVKNEGYPWGFLHAIKDLALEINSLIYSLLPNTIVIEETNSARQRHIQKALEYLHCMVLEGISKNLINVVYISTSTWRKTVGLTLSKDQHKNNAKVSKAKREGKSKKSLGLKGKITPKHLAVQKANEIFNLQLKIKDDDIADACLLGLAYIRGAEPCTYLK